jgi:glycine cleavage system H lipoate-binding protein
VWANITVPGLVRVGLDDFARKMIGRIDAIELPGKGAMVKKGDRLFSLRQGGRVAVFSAPISGKVHDLNADLPHHLEWLVSRPYEKGWVCSIKPEHLADELGQLKIGDMAAEWYRTEIARLRLLLEETQGGEDASTAPTRGGLAEGQLEEADDATWTKFTQAFLQG